MCFHTKQSKSAIELENRYNARVEEALLFETNAIYNGFTFPKTPVISNENINLIKHYRWGLIPYWAKDNTVRANTLNARIETIKTLPSFRDSVKNRCLVIISGFYEWMWLDEKGKNKQKYLITFPKDELFSLGGIWSEWVDKSTGEIIKSYSIVTTEANELMAKIHNNKKRMPIVLNQSEEKKWLEGEDTEKFKVREVELKAIIV